MSKILPLAILCASFVFSPQRALSAPIIAIAPSASSVDVGGSLSIDVTIADAIDVYAYQFDLEFDSAVFRADDVLEGAFLAAGGGTFFIPGSIDNASGTVSFTIGSLLLAVPGVSGGGTLATLTLKALNAGTSALMLSNVLFLDSSLTEIADVTSEGGRVTVRGSVPEPGTLILTTLGLVIAARRRRRVV